MATITSTKLEYEGSIAVSPDLIAAAGFYIGEKVAVFNFDNGNRFETYIIKGEKGEIGFRGPAARLGKIGERVVILSYGIFSEEEAKRHSPKVVLLTKDNSIKIEESQL